MQTTVHAAKKNPEKLIKAALSGEEVIIARGNTPIVKLVPLPTKRRFEFDILKGKLKGPIPDFLEPMSEEELALWEGRSCRATS